MATSAYEAYAESRILSADPLELIQILYETALEAVNAARGHLREGDIAARSKQITRACAILVELSISVRQDVDSAMSQNLIELYDYMQRRLLEANMQQVDPPLAEAGKLLGTLLDAWIQCRKSIAPPEVEMAAASAGTNRWEEPAEAVHELWTA